MVNLSFSNLCSHINNGIISRRKFIFVPHTNLNYQFLKKLLKRGFLESIMCFKKSGYILVNLNLFSQSSVISRIEIISKPTKIIYCNYSNLLKIQEHSMILVSTSMGILTRREAILFRKGGIVLCKIF
jgi:ribosomal protein S8